MIDKSKYILTPEGSFKSTAFGNPADIYTDNYWSAHQNHSTLEEQKANVVEKNKLVVREIFDGPILEIACAPGSLLRELGRRGFECMGIEVDPKYKYELRKESKCAIHFGLFPEVTKDWIPNMFGSIIALDVIEHVEDGMAFIAECYRLLKPDGVLIIQAPIILEDGLMDDNMFHCYEHIWIYNIYHLRQMIEASGFDVRSVSRWKIGHEQVVAIKK